MTSRNGGSVSVSPEGTVTIRSASAMTLILSADNHLNITTADGSRVSLSEDDSLLLMNDRHAVVFFPNANAMVVTKEEIISLESDGTVIMTDSQGSVAQMAMDSNGVPCQPQC